MSKRSTWVAWSLLGAYTAGIGATVVLAVANGRFERDWQGLIAQTLAFAAYSVIGALIVARRPDNAMGWVFSAIGLLAATMLVTGEYAQYAYVTRPHPLPGAIVAAWFPPTAIYALYVSTVTLPLLLFPTGRLLSPRWRPVLWITGAVIVGLTGLTGLHPDLPLSDGQHVIANPLAFVGVELPRVGQVDGVVLLVVAAALVSVIVRFRRARGEERQQLKWFVYGAGLTVVLGMLGFLRFPRADTLSSALTLEPAAGRRRGRDPAVSAVRHRPADQPHPGLRAAHGHPRAVLCGRIVGVHSGGGGRVRPAELAGRRRDAGCGRGVPTGPTPYPAGG